MINALISQLPDFFFCKFYLTHLFSRLRYCRASTIPDLSSSAQQNTIYYPSQVYITLREILRRSSLKAGIETPSPHDFRRAFCLECLRKGIDLLTISRLMGHTSLALIARYAKQVKGDLGEKYKSIIDD